VSDDFTETLVVADVRPGASGVELSLEQGVAVVRVGDRESQVDYGELLRAVSAIDGRPRRKSLKHGLRDLALRPFSYLVAALLSRDLTPGDVLDDDERPVRER
jgi:hypothetical protein